MQRGYWTSVRGSRTVAFPRSGSTPVAMGMSPFGVMGVMRTQQLYTTHAATLTRNTHHNALSQWRAFATNTSDQPPAAEETEAKDPLHNSIDKVVKQYPCVVFMKGTPTQPQCGFSARVVSILNNAGAHFQAVDVLANPAVRDGIKKYTSWPTIPQVFVAGEFIGGCDIVTDHDKKNTLLPMLTKAGALNPPSSSSSS
eukprot:TRINITY_DN4690_c0_g1_i1.p1 TRINITY_DN4690_c0_g1~~TRINITY_DN4690_c0_g1_i1.p1  ORF type:complete len:198 (-),score=29.67 TRINITY_DN4690_c0_g1_i1:49-642(-)